MLEIPTSTTTQQMITADRQLTNCQPNVLSNSYCPDKQTMCAALHRQVLLLLSTLAIGYNEYLAHTPSYATQLATQKMSVDVLDFSSQNLISHHNNGSRSGEGMSGGLLLRCLACAPCSFHAAVRQHISWSKAAIFLAQQTATQVKQVDKQIV